MPSTEILKVHVESNFWNGGPGLVREYTDAQGNTARLRFDGYGTRTKPAQEIVDVIVAQGLAGPTSCRLEGQRVTDFKAGIQPSSLAQFGGNLLRGLTLQPSEVEAQAELISRACSGSETVYLNRGGKGR